MEFQYSITDFNASGIDNPSSILQNNAKTDDEPESMKTFSCNYPGCEKSFRYKSEILRHLVTHTNSRPYVCPYKECRKSFKRTDALATHIRIHTREKPFKCPSSFCQSAFSTKAGLKYHLSKHKNENLEALDNLDDPAGIPTNDSAQLENDGKQDLHVAGDSKPTTSEPVNTDTKKQARLPSTASEFEPEIKKRIHHSQPLYENDKAPEKYQQLSILSMNLKTTCAGPSESKAHSSKILPLSLHSLLKAANNPRAMGDLHLAEVPEHNTAQDQRKKNYNRFNENQQENPQEKGKLHSIINKILEENDSLKKNLEYCQSIIRNYHGDGVNSHKHHSYNSLF